MVVLLSGIFKLGMFSLKSFSGLLKKNCIDDYVPSLPEFELSNLTRKTKGSLRNGRFYAPRMNLYCSLTELSSAVIDDIYYHVNHIFPYPCIYIYFNDFIFICKINQYFLS